MFQLKFYTNRFFISIVAAIAMTFLFSGCATNANSNASNNSSNSTSPHGKIKVVAAENFLGEVAAAVGGDRVDVTSIINNPDAEPHEFEPTADTSKAVSDAQVVVYIGIGYDDWMEKLLKASSGSKSVISVGTDLLGKKAGDNPHVWYIPESMSKLADALAQQLAKIDPGQAEAFKQRAQAYKTQLAPINELVQKLKQSSPTDIAVSEPVFDYMAEALNLRIVNSKFAQSIEEESDPAPRDIADLQNAIKAKKIKLFVQNKQAESPTVINIAELAKSSQIPIVYVTETEPPGKNYVQWMSDQLNEIENALGVK